MIRESLRLDENLIEQLNQEIKELKELLMQARREIIAYDAIHGRKPIIDCIKERGWVELLKETTDGRKR
jgi:hypothetical protein